MLIKDKVLVKFVDRPEKRDLMVRAHKVPFLRPVHIIISNLLTVELCPIIFHPVMSKKKM